MGISGQFGAESKWHDPAFVSRWLDDLRTSRQRRHVAYQAEASSSVLDAPLLSGIALSAHAPSDAKQLAHAHAEQWAHVHERTLTSRAAMLDGGKYLQPAKKRDARTAHRPPELLFVDADGNSHLPEWLIARENVRPEKIAKAEALYKLGEKKKAQRELACGLLGGPVVCRSGHEFKIPYRCGHRFCIDCAQSYSNRLFARAWERMKPVAKVLCPCWPPHSREDRRAIVHEIGSVLDEIQRAKCGHGSRKKAKLAELRHELSKFCCSIPVMATIDFTLRSDGTLSNAERQTALGQSVKKFFRACEHEFGFTRERYGAAIHMETSQANMSHAHGCYVGPWLPNKGKQLSKIWKRVSPDGSFIISIKYARSLPQALAHATKYPRKLIKHSTPERLAELEHAYNKVRMFRFLGAFDKRVATKVLGSVGIVLPEPEKTAGRKCPLCGEAVSEPQGWRLLSELRHLPDLAETQIRVNRERVLCGNPHGPP